jgi:putative SOS response-associated peptidase YedK
MCNLYSITTNQDAIRRLFGALNSRVGNLAPMPGVFPDYPAPIVRNASDGRELVMARWGMPSSSRALMDANKKRARKLEAKGKPVDFKQLLRMEPDGGTTNIRNVTSAHWRRWLGPENRCLVPFNCFPSMTPSMAGRCRSGSRSTKAGRCCASRASGPTGPACARQRKAKSPRTFSQC